MYKKLSGMTGTAMTEESEFQEIYNLDVIAIPTNKPMARKDYNDVIYKDELIKFKAIINDIKESYEKGQPVLVGTVSVEKSEKLSKLLKAEGIPHEVLNAKYHDKEAEIIAQAGKYKAVTIATNMAGRGTDIMLGGNSEYLAKREMRKKGYRAEVIERADTHEEMDDGFKIIDNLGIEIQIEPEEIKNARLVFQELNAKFKSEIKEEREKVISAGGLKIIGTERHESRRIDNQLRGRSGRQGDNGESRFYIALDDDLMKIFGGDRVQKVFTMVGADETTPIQLGLITRAVESAQKKVESKNFSIRKHVLQYDDVMNVQREQIYSQRREVLDGENIRENIITMIKSVAEEIVLTYAGGVDNASELNIEGLSTELKETFNIDPTESINKGISENGKGAVNAEAIIEDVSAKALELYAEKEEEIGEQIREIERVVVLKIVDQKWMDHIDAMDELKNGIGLRAYAQKNPVVQYRLEGKDMYDEMIYNVKHDIVKILTHLHKNEQIERKQQATITKQALEETVKMNMMSEEEKDAIEKKKINDHIPVVNGEPKVGRNDACPCGSGKKYKNCCGK
jgi:preprotein translocase subunit SecA